VDGEEACVLVSNLRGSHVTSSDEFSRSYNPIKESE
jgi:hypothetical protein